MRLVTVKQASVAVEISSYALLKGAKEGIYPHEKSGNRFLFDVDLLEETIRGRMLKSCGERSGGDLT